MIDAEQQHPQPKIFISYRIADTQAVAGRLADQLRTRFGFEQVFLDTSTIQPGDRWPSRIASAVKAAEVVLVLIGKQWLSVRDEFFTRRLDKPDDWVRCEVETALAGTARVIPVLLDGADLPQKETFSSIPSIADLADCQAAELRNAKWEVDFRALAEQLETLVPTACAGSHTPDPDEAERRTTITSITYGNSNTVISAGRYIVHHEALKEERRASLDRPPTRSRTQPSSGEAGEGSTEDAVRVQRIIKLAKRLLGNAIPLDDAGRDALLSDAFLASPDDPRKKLVLVGPADVLANQWTEVLYNHGCIAGRSALSILLLTAYVFRARKLPDGLRRVDFFKLIADLDDLARG